jgi:hypothetical protein
MTTVNPPTGRPGRMAMWSARLLINKVRICRNRQSRRGRDAPSLVVALPVYSVTSTRCGSPRWGIPKEVLLDDLRAVHQRHGSSEHPFALSEVRCIRDLFSELSEDEVKQQLDPAFYAFNKARKRTFNYIPAYMRRLKQSMLKVFLWSPIPTLGRLTVRIESIARSKAVYQTALCARPAPVVFRPHLRRRTRLRDCFAARRSQTESENATRHL